MEAPLELDEQPSARDTAREADGVERRLGAGAEEDDLLGAGHEARDLLRELDLDRRDADTGDVHPSALVDESRNTSGSPWPRITGP